MTTIASFATISHHYKKLYLMSDSRITWPINGLPTFDNSTKIFPLKDGSDVFAYCGDSLFSLSVLSRIKTQLESYYDYVKSNNVDWKMEKVKAFLNMSLSHYPKDHLTQNIEITHFMAVENEFYGFRYCFNHETKKPFKEEKINVPNQTGFVDASGSGAADFRIQLTKQFNNYGQHAYSIFYTFYEFIKSGNDPKTGGAPQIVQLGSDGKIKLIGIYSDGEINVLGESNEFWKNEYSIEIRSKFFELVDSEGERLTNEKDRSYQEFIK